jgi:hypothetical protein
MKIKKKRNGEWTLDGGNKNFKATTRSRQHIKVGTQ